MAGHDQRKTPQTGKDRLPPAAHGTDGAADRDGPGPREERDRAGRCGAALSGAPAPTAGDLVEYRRFVPAEADLLAAFLTREDWPYHGAGAPDADQIRRDAAAGHYDNDQTRTFWIVAGTEVGLVRLLDLADDTPLFDLRISAAYRRAGLGTRALRWLTTYVFTEFPGILRLEGTTRQDNQAMRRTFRKCGYVKEAHYRQAWSAPNGTVHDAVGYAILRSDWQSGTITMPEWDDEPT